jgi:hypothetical protein
MAIDAEILAQLAAAPLAKSAITALTVLNEASDYKSRFHEVCGSTSMV